jgi:hypothetical protein
MCPQIMNPKTYCLITALIFHSVCSGADPLVPNESYPVHFSETAGFYLIAEYKETVIEFDESSDRVALVSLLPLDLSILEPNSGAELLTGVYVVGKRIGENKDKEGKSVTKFQLLGWFIKSPYLQIIDTDSLLEPPRFSIVANRLPLKSFEMVARTKDDRRMLTNLKIHWKKRLRISWIGKQPDWISSTVIRHPVRKNN